MATFAILMLLGTLSFLGAFPMGLYSVYVGRVFLVAAFSSPEIYTSQIVTSSTFTQIAGSPYFL